MILFSLSFFFFFFKFTFSLPLYSDFPRAVASLTVPGRVGKSSILSSFFLKFQSIFLIFPQTLVSVRCKETLIWILVSLWIYLMYAQGIARHGKPCREYDELIIIHMTVVYMNMHIFKYILNVFLTSNTYPNFTYFLPHFGPPGGRVAHPGRPWLRHWISPLTL